MSTDGLSRRGFMKGASAVLAGALAPLGAFSQNASASQKDALYSLEKLVLSSTPEHSYQAQQILAVQEYINGSLRLAPQFISQILQLAGASETLEDLTGVDVNGTFYLLGRVRSNNQDNWYIPSSSGRISVQQLLMDLFQVPGVLPRFVPAKVRQIKTFGNNLAVVFDAQGQKHLYDLAQPRPSYLGNINQLFTSRFGMNPADLKSTQSKLYLIGADGMANEYSWQRLLSELGSSASRLTIDRSFRLADLFQDSSMQGSVSQTFTNPSSNSLYAVRNAASTYSVQLTARHYQTNAPVANARVIIGDAQAIADANGVARLELPASFTGVQDVIIDARNLGYSLRGFQQNFDGSNKILEDRIVPVQKPGLTVAQEENDPMTFSWDLAEATARFEGADLSQLTTTGLVHGGHTVAYRNPLPRTRDPNGVRYMIITERATPEEIRVAEQAIIEVIGLAYGVTLTSNDIEKLPVLPPLSERPGAQYVRRWRDLGGDFGGTAQSLQGNYAMISDVSVVPGIINSDLRLAVDRHEASRGTGINRGTYYGDLIRRYNAQVSIFPPEMDTNNFRTDFSSVDRKIFDFFRVRFLTGGPGNTSTTKNVPGLGNTFILDYSPLNR